MKIIHIVSAISEEASGPSYAVTGLCTELVKQGQDATLAVLDWAPMPNPPSFVRSFPLGRGPRRLGRSPMMHRWLKQQAASTRVDIIHAHGLWMMPNVYPGWVCRKYDIPYVVSPHGVFTEYAMASGSKVKRVFWPLFQRPALHAAGVFHATAESEYKDIRRMGFRQPVAIIPLGIDVPMLRRKTPSSVRGLLFLGRIHPNKGLDMLLPAWKVIQARFPDWRLKIVGSDDGYYAASGYMADMRNLSAKLGLQRVDFVGALYGGAKWKAYADADLFVLPTYSENFGMSVAEALAAGLPAIVSKGAPWSGLAEHDAGRWIDIGLEPLVAAFEDLMQRSPEELRAMGRRGRKWILNDYSWSRIGQQMRDVYRWLVGESSIAPACVKFE